MVQFITTHHRAPRLILPQSLGAILEIEQAKHNLSCVASHVRYNRTAWQGRLLRPPVASLQTRGLSHHPGPTTKAFRLGTDQRAFVPLGTQTGGFRTPGPRLQGPAPLDPCAGGRSRAAGVVAPPSPRPKGNFRRLTPPSGPLEPLRQDTACGVHAAMGRSAPGHRAPEKAPGDRTRSECRGKRGGCGGQ